MGPTNIPSLVHISLLPFRFYEISWLGLSKTMSHGVGKFCRSIVNGGLGVHSLKDMNQALLSKWLWHYIVEKNALWRKVIEVKYGSSSIGWAPALCYGPYGLVVWKGIATGFDYFSKRVSF